MEKPVSLSLRGITISELTDFRYDVSANEHQFFQLTFKRFLLNTLPDFDLNAPESFSNTPVTLNFSTGAGKIKQVTANIVILKGIDRPGRVPEISIAGTFYSPEGKFPKLNRFLLSAVVLPMFLIIMSFLYVNHLCHNLVVSNGAIGFYEAGSSYKGSKSYTFKIVPFQASFKRSYHRPLFDNASEHINALFTGSDNDYHADSTGQSVRFYVFKADVDKLYDKDRTVAFFNLQHAKSPYSSLDQFIDVFYYAKDHVWLYLVFIVYAFLEIAFIGFVFFYYKMFAFYNDRRKKIFFWSFAVLVVIFNIPVVFIFI